MVRKIPTMATSAGAMQLQAMAERLETQGELRNPIIEQALMKAAREQSQAAVETTEQAAGMTGAAQVGMTALAQLQALGQASMQAQAQRVERMRATMELQASLRGQVAQLEEQRYQTNLQHQQFMEQLRMQEEQQKGNMLASVAGGALAAFAGGPGLAAMLGGGGAATAATSGMAAATAGTAVPQIIQSGMPAVTQAINPFGGAMQGAYGLNALGLTTGGRGTLF